MCRWCRGARGVRVRRAGAGRESIGRAGGYVGGLSGPMLLSQVAAIRDKSIGPEGPPTKVRSPAAAAGRIAADLMDEYVECW
ncbi:DUF6053 domain-containing protein [Lysobacter enzymogenes]|uniref:DUF6053 domain-containing protein n=1 Tax=Lysobacter enzymogenes TaxID=69 RepID=UPI003CCCA678